MYLELEDIGKIENIFNKNIKNISFIKKVRANIKRFEYYFENELIKEIERGNNFTRNDFKEYERKINFLYKVTIGIEKGKFLSEKNEDENLREVFIMIYKKFEKVFKINQKEIDCKKYNKWLGEML